MFFYRINKYIYSKKMDLDKKKLKNGKYIFLIDIAF